MKHPIEWHEGIAAGHHYLLEKLHEDPDRNQDAIYWRTGRLLRLTDQLAAAKRLGLTEFDAETFQP